jgi:thiol-disulfide isomerase/thioredoxin
MLCIAVGLMACAGVARADLKAIEPRPAPALRIADLGGRAHDLAAYRGRVVLVNFWASWCPPCRKEMPSMQRLAGRLREAPFIILAVDSGDPREDVDAFLATMRLDFPILYEQDAVTMRAWKVFTLPSSFLIDKRGQVRYILSGAIEWDEAEPLAHIQRLLAE